MFIPNSSGKYEVNLSVKNEITVVCGDNGWSMEESGNGNLPFCKQGKIISDVSTYTFCVNNNSCYLT